MATGQLKLFVWNSISGAIWYEQFGHVSLDLGGDYLSFWPTGSHMNMFGSPGRLSPGYMKNTSVIPISNNQARLLSDTVRMAPGKNGKLPPRGTPLKNMKERFADVVIDFGSCLNVPAIQTYLLDLRKNPGRYHILTCNCASVVAEALKSGGASKRVSMSGWPVWTPESLQNYCSALKKSCP